ncbi:lactococcin 972 family bacteriocin [Bacillus sp. NPDC077411]|uniref:lactococcin 972 family bacteriocin n=1 Tax=Bacillus sp. NPDC077411 TaxID=3363947 RepID=UPI0037C6E48A
MKKVASIFSLVLMLSVGGVSAFASTGNSQHGEFNYDLHPIYGVVDYVGGGKWTHYIDGMYTNYSKYEHDKLTHSTYVKSGWTSDSSGWVDAGYEAIASCKPALSGNIAKWNTK